MRNAECTLLLRERGHERNSESNEKEVTRAKNSAYRYLSYRPRSHAEVEQKLRDKGFCDAIVGTVLSDLARFGFINDEQFADQWARSRVRLRGLGRRRIEQELRDKGVDAEIISRTLTGIFSSTLEIDTAKKTAAKKLGIMKNVDRDTRRRRLAGFLERKGFSYEIIRSILKGTE